MTIHPCPSCGRTHSRYPNGDVPVELSGQCAQRFSEPQWRVQCRCGTCGPIAVSSSRAVEAWNAMPRKGESDG